MGLTAEYDQERIRIFRYGTDQPLIVQNAQADHRPFIHPISGPDGTGCLTENEPDHHLWQHGLYVGLNDVNGVGFWLENLTSIPNDGSFHPAPLLAPKVQGSQAGWRVDTEWRDPQGAPMIAETQQWTFNDQTDRFILDLDWTLRGHIDLKFGEYPYGGLFLRMPYRKDAEATALNSEGLRDTAAEAKRARWLAVGMKIEGRAAPAGMAIMDHPGNFRHPVPWRIDDQYGIAPSCSIAGAWTIPAGGSIHFKYRVFVFDGLPDAVQIEAIWEQFSELIK